eukprot:TRINITY_DN9098_c0_g1_i1.p1 TRINITY_DN9098_c0_g1~~TRINITY_DN9098_c0_g1_i1.p1  ORF type:complete len:295 (-),score=72.40 TRINITY_DN9098_c0_g1_i1:83-967(-)
MRFTVASDSGDLSNFEVDENEHIENIKALIEVEMKIPLSQQQLEFNGKVLQNQDTLKSSGLREGEILLVRRLAAQSSVQRSVAPSIQRPGTPPQTHRLYQIIRQNPGQILPQLQKNDPELYKEVMANNVNRIESLLVDRAERQQREIEAIEADPMNPEYQQRIAEAIRLQNVEANMEQAIEHTPEAFTHVTMLYCHCTVNGVPVKAFIDSGAQSTIMSVRCAEKCGIMRLVDQRFQGMAKGVGTAKILGKVHIVPIKIGNAHFPCSFTILESDGVEFLLGLDMLKRHQVHNIST